MATSAVSSQKIRRTTGIPWFTLVGWAPVVGRTVIIDQQAATPGDLLVECEGHPALQQAGFQPIAMFSGRPQSVLSHNMTDNILEELEAKLLNGQEQRYARDMAWTVVAFWRDSGEVLGPKASVLTADNGFLALSAPLTALARPSELHVLAALKGRPKRVWALGDENHDPHAVISQTKKQSSRLPAPQKAKP